MKAYLIRLSLKGAVFALFMLVVLNPNLKRAALQLKHWGNPESLIQPDFNGITGINCDLDRLVRRYPHIKEARLIEAYVYKKIPYATDYRNWGNAEYWPTAQEVWDRQQEDCDGRAILAVSIMRSRGYRSSRLVVGLNHMWTEVDQNEKIGRGEQQMTALMDPRRQVNFQLPDQPGWQHVGQVLRALTHPTALRDTSSGVFGDIPAIRKGILLALFLVLCYVPGRDWRIVGLLIFTGAAAACLFHQAPSTAGVAAWVGGSALMTTGLAASFLLNKKVSTHDKPIHPVAAV